MKKLTGHLEEKNGKWYAAVNHYTTDGKRKVKWYSLDLESRKGSKTEANHRLRALLEKLNTGNTYLTENMTHAERERHRVANMLVEDYLIEWLESHRGNVSKTTYEGYKTYIESKMIPFFKEMHIKVNEITGDEINSFYTSLRKMGLKGTSMQRYHSVLHLAFKTAMKRKIIPSNPVEQADRPKATQFIANFYNAEEIKELLECAKSDELYLIILLAVYYGLRRSEVIGLKWSAIDFYQKTISIRHKVVDEKNGPVGYDVMKTKSSYRTLPLLPFIEEALIAKRDECLEMQRVMGRSYRSEHREYVNVDALGRLYRPNYVTDHFGVILRQNNLRHIRFHDLRHSCASLLLANKIPMKMIQDWLGHSDMGTTSNIYSHLDANSKIDSANVIGAALARGT